MAGSDFLDHSEKVRLLNTLHSQTVTGKLVWRAPVTDPEKTNQKPNDTFISGIKNFGFILSSVDRDGVAPYQIAIYKDAKEFVSAIEMAALDEGGNENINELVNSLYQEVFRRVRRPDEIIRELFQVINEIDPEPPF